MDESDSDRGTATVTGLSGQSVRGARHAHTFQGITPQVNLEQAWQPVQAPDPLAERAVDGLKHGQVVQAGCVGPGR